MAQSRTITRLPDGNYDAYFRGKPKETASQKAGKPKPVAKPKKPKNEPWRPLTDPLPSLADIRAEAQKAARDAVAAQLGALPTDTSLTSRRDSVLGAIAPATQQAQASIAGLAQYGVNEGNAGIQNQQAANAAAANQAGIAPGSNPALGSSIYDLLGKQGAGQGNVLNAVAAATTLQGTGQAAEINRSYQDQLAELEAQRTAIKASQPTAFQEGFNKLREFYLGIAGGQQQGMLAAEELGLNAQKAQQDAMLAQAGLQLDADKAEEAARNNRFNNQIAQGSLDLDRLRLDLDVAKERADLGVSEFNQWYKQQQLNLQRAGVRIRQGQLELAIQKAQQTDLNVKRPDINKIFNNIDSMFNQNSVTENKKVTSYDYTFYGQNDGDSANAPVKAFTVSGRSFDEALRKAKARALGEQYIVPTNWRQNVGAPGENGYGPAFREERTNEKTETVKLTKAKYTIDQIMQTNIKRLQSMGFQYNDANMFVRSYMSSLVPLRELNNWSRSYWAR